MAVFHAASEGKDRKFYLIYPDSHGTLWIKFFGQFCYDPRFSRKPWKIQEYFGAEFKLEDFLCVDETIIAESLSEIRQTIGNMNDQDALHAMNHFFTEYVFPPIDKPFHFLAIKEINEDTPPGLYVS